MSDPVSHEAVRPRPGRIRGRRDFADELTEIRERAGLTVRQVAGLVGVQGAHSTIGDWFAGRGLPSQSSQGLFVKVLAVCGVIDAEQVQQWLDAWRRVRRIPGPRPGGAEPYRGLSSFQIDDAEWFFGRQALTDGLLAHLAHLDRAGGGVQVVVGPSGSGKSSVLRAGLIPAINRGAIGASAGWPVVLLTPGARPVDELAARLATSAKVPAAEVASAIRSDPSQCARYARQAAAAPPRREDLPATSTEPGAPGAPRLVLVVDQFEELFTACLDDGDRQLFVAALCAAASSAGGALVVVGVRADFYAPLLRYPRLVAAVQAGQVAVGPMSEAELREAITGPAQKAKIEIEEGLVELLLREVSPSGASRVPGAGHDPGGLPLLSYALYATWDHGQGRRLSIADYRAVGGISQAVAASADRVYDALSQPQQELARSIFLSMVRLAPDTADTRRRVTVAQLYRQYPGADTAEVDEVLDRFVAQRLLTVDQDTVEISHDALLIAWPQLRAWLDTDRAGLIIGQQLADSSAAWLHDQRDPGGLYQGTRLAAAQAWATDHRPDLPRPTLEFLDASIRYARRRTTRLYQLVAALTVLVLVASLFAGYAFQQRAAANAQRRDAIRERNQAISRLVAARATKLRTADVSLSMQLSLAAYRIAPTVEARSSLLDSFVTPAATRLRAFTGAAQSVAFSPDKRLLAATGLDATVHLWDVTKPQHPVPLGKPLTGAQQALFCLAFSPDGHTLAVAGADTHIRLWDISSPDRPIALTTLSGPISTIYAVAFSPDRRLLAAASADKTVHLWDLTSPGQPAPVTTLTGPSDAVQAVAFSPDSRILAAGSADTTVRLWSVSDPRHPLPLGPPLTGPTLKVYTVAFSPDGHTLAAGSGDDTVRLWNLADPARPVPFPGPLTGPTSWVNAVVFSPDGRSIAAGCSDDTITVWDLATGHVSIRLPHPAPVTAVAFGADGHTLASSSTDGAIRLWAFPGPILTGPTSGVFGVTFNPDGHTIAAASRDGTVWLWGVTDPRQPVRLGPPLTSPSHEAPFAGTAAFSPAGSVLAIGTRTGPVQLWDTTDPTRPALLGPPLTGPTALVETVAFSPDGHLLAAGGDDTNVHLWNVTDPRHPTSLATITHTGSLIFFVAFSPDGHTLAVATADTTVRLWDVTRPDQPTALGPPLTGPRSYTYSVAFSPDGRTLAEGSADGTVRLWDLTHPQRPIPIGPPITGPTGYVYWVAYSPDGHTLTAGVTDNTIWQWDVSHPRQPALLATLESATNAIYTVGYSPNGRVLAASGSDTTVRLWDPDPQRVAQWICAVAGDPITLDEWKQYIPGAVFTPSCKQP